jgi:hypothetical protein
MTATTTTATTPMLAGQLSCRVRRERLERNTTDDDHDIGRRLDTDPPGQQTPIPPLARPVRCVFHGVLPLL